jgi:alkyl hydroperoxide reductase subunit AhpC
MPEAVAARLSRARHASAQVGPSARGQASGFADRCVRAAERAFVSVLRGGDMALQLGDIAPDFEAETTAGKIRFHQWIDNSWAVLFSHPKNFTPVCTTELGYTAKLKPEFDKRGVKVVGLSVDPLESHAKWSDDIKETQGHALNFPLIADADRKVANLYGMIHPNANDTLTVRSVFIIGLDKKIKLTLTYPASPDGISMRSCGLSILYSSRPNIRLQRPSIGRRARM